MKTLLRNVASGLYVRGPNHWTRDPDEAHDFRLIDRALEFVEKTGLKEMELAFAFDDPQSITGVSLEKTALGYCEE